MYSSVLFFSSAANYVSKFDYFKSPNNPNTESIASADLVPVYISARI